MQVSLRVLPIVSVFGGLAVAAFYYLHVQQSAVGLKQVFELHCPPHGGDGIGIAAYRRYTGLHDVDFTMCMLVNVFDFLLRPPLRLVNVPVLLSLPAAWLVCTLDAASLFPNRRLLAIGTPLLFGLAAQLLGGGIAFPLYWAFSLVARVKARAEGLPLARPDSCGIIGIFLGITLGVAPITVAMIVWPTQLLITLWQPLPLYLAAIQLAVVPFFSHTPHPSSELRRPDHRIYRFTQLFAVLCMLIATPGHIPFLREVLSSPAPKEMLIDAFLPYLYEFKYRSNRDLMMFGPENEVKRFTQWDVLFIFASAWLAGAWSWAFSDAWSFLLALSITGASTLALGPGALIIVPYMIQARIDENTRFQLSKERIAKKAQ